MYAISFKASHIHVPIKCQVTIISSHCDCPVTVHLIFAMENCSFPLNNGLIHHKSVTFMIIYLKVSSERLGPGASAPKMCIMTSPKNVHNYQPQIYASLPAPKKCFITSPRNVINYQHQKCVSFPAPKICIIKSPKNMIHDQHQMCASLPARDGKTCKLG